MQCAKMLFSYKVSIASLPYAYDFYYYFFFKSPET